jgi:hypothetical protein
MPFAESLLALTRSSAIDMKNPRRTTAVALDHRVWRDLTRLAVQGLAAGVIVSVLLGLAVFIVA